MQHTRRICVRGLIYKDGKLFGQKLRNTGGDWWCTPGGGVDEMESLHAALTRELIEETGVKPVIGRLILIQQFATNDTTSHVEKEQLEFFFLIENAADYQFVDLASTSHGAQEVAEFGFVDPAAKNMLPAILQTPDFNNALTNLRPVIFYTAM